jgi:hypothetical protein
MIQMIRSFIYNYVCRLLHGNRDNTVIKLRGYRLGARVLFLTEALVFFFFTLSRVRQSTDLIVYVVPSSDAVLRTHLLAVVCKVTDVSYFSYIFSKAVSEICHITVGQILYEFQVLNSIHQSINLILWLVQAGSISIKKCCGVWQINVSGEK